MADNSNVPLIKAPKGPIKTRPKPEQQPKPKPFDDPDAERIPTDAEAKSMRDGYKKGGMVKSDEAQDKKMIASMIHKHEKREHPGKPLTKFKGGGSVSKRADGIAQRGRTKGKMV